MAGADRRRESGDSMGSSECEIAGSGCGQDRSRRIFGRRTWRCSQPERATVRKGKNGTPGVSTKLAACCAYYPATEVRARPDGAANVLMPAGADEAAHRAASPLTYVAKGFPPTVVFHGTADVTIPIESSERLFKQFREAQIPSEFHAFEGVPHAFDSNPEFAKECAQLSDFFID